MVSLVLVVSVTEKDSVAAEVDEATPAMTSINALPSRQARFTVVRAGRMETIVGAWHRRGVRTSLEDAQYCHEASRSKSLVVGNQLLPNTGLTCRSEPKTATPRRFHWAVRFPIISA